MNHMGTSNNFAEAESSCTHIRKEANNIPFFLESRLLESREKGHEGNFYCLCALEIRASGRKGIFSQDLVALRAAQDIGCYTHYFKRPYFVQRLKMLIFLITHCLKIPQNVSIEFSHFGIFQQFLSFLH